MGRSCSVPNCRSNYDSKDGHITSFSFTKGVAEKSLELRNKWIKGINRDNWTPGKSACVCILHFAEQFLVREDVMTRPDGSVLRVPRTRVALKEGAYPTIFKNQPSYLSVVLPSPRTDPNERTARTGLAFKSDNDKWMMLDLINSFEDFKNSCMYKVDATWTLISLDKCVHFIKYNPLSFKADICLQVKSDLQFGVYHNSVPVPLKQFLFMATKKQYLCDRWSKLENLLARLKHWDVKECSVEEGIRFASSVVLSCISKIKCNVCEDFCGGVCCGDSSSDSDEKDIVWKKLVFIHEQLDLLLSKRPSYSPETLIWTFTLHLESPSGYCNLRDTHVLTLPHPMYLKKLSQKLGGLNESGLKTGHVKYLTEKCKKLSVAERSVNVILDEIHVKSQISYKGGHVEGQSLNCNEEATAVQAFMLSSLYSKNRDIVGLFPVKNQNGEQLREYINQVLLVLHQAGYIVFSLISDNHQINRLAFTSLGNGQLSVKVKNPIVPANDIFIIFDNVHLLKNIRNNWFNQDDDQTFEFPNFYDFTIRENASVKILKDLHKKEVSNVVKIAPALSQKVLYPSSTERQNVSHAIRLFDEKTIAALDKIDRAQGTMKFLQVILTWWKIVNVKSPLKGVRLRDPYQHPINSITHVGYQFLVRFELWLKAWQNLVVQRQKRRVKSRCTTGKLTKETHTALCLSTRAMIQISEELLQLDSISYVLLGKFQSDNIEGRFRLYRQLSGSCYHISVQQVLESERKLKLLSLLRLKSATKGAFELKDILDSCSTSVDEEVDVHIEAVFQSVVCDSDCIDVSTEQMEALIYIGGYVGNRALKNIKCCFCRDFLLDPCKQLSIEYLPRNVGDYLRFIDRGGLNYPTEFTMNICLSAFKVFQILIGEVYEAEYMASCSQKRVLNKLIMERLHTLNIILDISCECGVGMIVLAQKCCNTMSNILLNNYSKLCNDKINASVCSKRKLKCLNTS